MASSDDIPMVEMLGDDGDDAGTPSIGGGMALPRPRQDVPLPPRLPSRPSIPMVAMMGEDENGSPDAATAAATASVAAAPSAARSAPPPLKPMLSLRFIPPSIDPDSSEGESDDDRGNAAASPRAAVAINTISPATKPRKLGLKINAEAASSLIVAGEVNAGSGSSPGDGLEQAFVKKQQKLALHTADDEEEVRPGLEARTSYEVTQDGTLRTQMYRLRKSGYQRTTMLTKKLRVAAGNAVAHELDALRSRSVQFGKLSSATLEQMGVLGRGASGQVTKSLHVPSMTIVALKSIDVTQKGRRQQFLQELYELDTLDCANIVEFHGAYYEEGHVFLALEFMDRGAMDTIVRNLAANERKPGEAAASSAAGTTPNPSKTPPKQVLPEPVVASAMKQVLLGLLYLHQKNKIHRDIKPGNFLVNSQGQVKLSDFGLTSSVDGRCRDSFVGTTIFMSPERITGSEYSLPSDIWSLGMSAIYMATGRAPIDTSDGYFGIVMAINAEHFQPDMPAEAYSAELRDFISMCLFKDPALRWTTEQLLAHPFIVGAKSVAETLPLWPQQMRMGVDLEAPDELQVHAKNWRAKQLDRKASMRFMLARKQLNRKTILTQAVGDEDDEEEDEESPFGGIIMLGSAAAAMATIAMSPPDSPQGDGKRDRKKVARRQNSHAEMYAAEFASTKAAADRAAILAKLQAEDRLDEGDEGGDEHSRERHVGFAASAIASALASLNGSGAASLRGSGANSPNFDARSPIARGVHISDAIEAHVALTERVRSRTGSFAGSPGVRSRRHSPLGSPMGAQFAQALMASMHGTPLRLNDEAAPAGFRMSQTFSPQRSQSPSQEKAPLGSPGLQSLRLDPSAPPLMQTSLNSPLSTIVASPIAPGSGGITALAQMQSHSRTPSSIHIPPPARVHVTTTTSGDNSPHHPQSPGQVDSPLSLAVHLQAQLSGGLAPISPSGTAQTGPYPQLPTTPHGMHSSSPLRVRHLRLASDGSVSNTSSPKGSFLHVNPGSPGHSNMNMLQFPNSPQGSPHSPQQGSPHHGIPAGTLSPRMTEGSPLLSSQGMDWSRATSGSNTPRTRGSHRHSRIINGNLVHIERMPVGAAAATGLASPRALSPAPGMSMSPTAAPLLGLPSPALTGQVAAEAAGADMNPSSRSGSQKGSARGSLVAADAPPGATAFNLLRESTIVSVTPLSAITPRSMTPQPPGGSRAASPLGGRQIAFMQYPAAPVSPSNNATASPTLSTLPPDVVLSALPAHLRRAPPSPSPPLMGEKPERHHQPILLKSNSKAGPGNIHAITIQTSPQPAGPIPGSNAGAGGGGTAGIGANLGANLIPSAVHSPPQSAGHLRTLSPSSGVAHKLGLMAAAADNRNRSHSADTPQPNSAPQGSGPSSNGSTADHSPFLAAPTPHDKLSQGSVSQGSPANSLQSFTATPNSSAGSDMTTAPVLELPKQAYPAESKDPSRISHPALVHAASAIEPSRATPVSADAPPPHPSLLHSTTMPMPAPVASLGVSASTPKRASLTTPSPTFDPSISPSRASGAPPPVAPLALTLAGLSSAPLFSSTSVTASLNASPTAETVSHSVSPMPGQSPLASSRSGVLGGALTPLTSPGSNSSPGSGHPARQRSLAPLGTPTSGHPPLSPQPPRTLSASVAALATPNTIHGWVGSKADGDALPALRGGSPRTVGMDSGRMSPGLGPGSVPPLHSGQGVSSGSGSPGMHAVGTSLRGASTSPHVSPGSRLRSLERSPIAVRPLDTSKTPPMSARILSPPAHMRAPSLDSSPALSPRLHPSVSRANSTGHKPSLSHTAESLTRKELAMLGIMENKSNSPIASASPGSGGGTGSPYTNSPVPDSASGDFSPLATSSLTSSIRSKKPSQTQAWRGAAGVAKPTHQSPPASLLPSIHAAGGTSKLDRPSSFSFDVSANSSDSAGPALVSTPLTPANAARNMAAARTAGPTSSGPSYLQPSPSNRSTSKSVTGVLAKGAPSRAAASSIKQTASAAVSGSSALKHPRKAPSLDTVPHGSPVASASAFTTVAANAWDSPARASPPVAEEDAPDPLAGSSDEDAEDNQADEPSISIQPMGRRRDTADGGDLELWAQSSAAEDSPAIAEAAKLRAMLDAPFAVKPVRSNSLSLAIRPSRSEDALAGMLSTLQPGARNGKLPTLGAVPAKLSLGTVHPRSKPSVSVPATIAARPFPAPSPSNRLAHSPI